MSLSSLISLLKAPVFADSERTRVASYLHYIFLIVIVGEVSFILTVALFAYVDREDIILGSSVLLSCLMLLWLTRLGYLRLASSIFIGGGLLAILTSGYSEHTIFTQMQQQRPTDFLPKPYLSDTLLNRVATVLNL